MTSTTFPRPSQDASAGGAARLVPSERLTALPTYVFAWLDELKASARARGAELIDLGMGNPDQPTPPAIIAAIGAAYSDPGSHAYPPFRGTERFRSAVARFMSRRFGVTVDADREILCLSGAKEGIAQTTMAFADAGTMSIVPDIHYPVHARATGLVGGTIHFIPLRRERGFLPDLGAIPAHVLRDARLLVLNYPHNPTGAVAPLELYEEAVALCRKHDILLISDLAYSEITFDGTVAPSVLQVSGAKDVTLEFHSFSKTFNMAGSRIGFAVGGPSLIDALHAVRTNMGYGTPMAIQAGAAFALDHHAELVQPVVARYQSRRDFVTAAFHSLGWASEPPRGSMFVWLPIPEGFGAQEWTKHLIDRADVVVTPGNAFGPGGERFFRVSLIAEPRVVARAVDRLRRAGIRYELAKQPPPPPIVCRVSTAPQHDYRSRMARHVHPVSANQEDKVADDRNPAEQDAMLDPEDVNSEPAGAERTTSPDPNDEIPVPIAMSPAEIDERAQAVEAMGGTSPAQPEDDRRNKA